MNTAATLVGMVLALASCAWLPAKPMQVEPLDLSDVEGAVIVADLVSVMVQDWPAAHTRVVVSAPADLSGVLEARLRAAGYEVAGAGERSQVVEMQAERIGGLPAYRAGLLVGRDWQLDRRYSRDRSGRLRPSSGFTLRGGRGVRGPQEPLGYGVRQDEIDFGDGIETEESGEVAAEMGIAKRLTGEGEALGSITERSVPFWSVQVLAGANREGLDKTRRRLADRGYEVTVAPMTGSGLSAVRVRARDGAQATQLAEVFGSSDYPGAFRVFEQVRVAKTDAVDTKTETARIDGIGEDAPAVLAAQDREPGETGNEPSGGPVAETDVGAKPAEKIEVGDQVVVMAPAADRACRGVSIESGSLRAAVSRALSACGMRLGGWIEGPGDSWIDWVVEHGYDVPTPRGLKDVLDHLKSAYGLGATVHVIDATVDFYRLGGAR